MTKKTSLMSFSEMTFKPPKTRRVPTIAIADNEVKLTGEALAAIWWRGRQWAVTEYGIECLDGTYTIEKARLLDGFPEWDAMVPTHMAEKEWVDIDELTTAWLVGLLMHGYHGIIEPDLLLKIFRRLPPSRGSI